MASVWRVYDSAVPKLAQLGTNTLKCALFTSSYTPARTDDSYSSLSGEVASGNGYTTGGVTLTGVTLTEVSGSWELDCDNIVAVTANGGDITCRYAVIYDDTDSGKQVVANCLIDNTPADVIVPDGYPLVLVTTNKVIKTYSTGWA